jgi:undecaprenyl-diphosphatase
MTNIFSSRNNHKTLFWGAVGSLWLIILTVLIGLTEDVVNSESIVSFDKIWADIFISWRSDLGINLFSKLTYLGNWQIVVPVLLVIIGILVIKKRQEFVGPFVFTMISSGTTTFIGKILISRFRPVGAAIVETDFSFPSGHATVAVAFYGFLAYLIIKLVKNKIKRQVVITSAILIVFIVGFSRLYLGVHYISDVLAGYLVGSLALIAGISLFKSNQK